LCQEYRELKYRGFDMSIGSLSLSLSSFFFFFFVIEFMTVALILILNEYLFQKFKLIKMNNFNDLIYITTCSDFELAFAVLLG
jgi:hypothetical protein